MLQLLSSPNKEAQPSLPLFKRIKVQSARFQFGYRFPDGSVLVGSVTGDRYHNKPDVIFNLRDLSGCYQDRHQRSLISFDSVFGQFNLDFPGPIFSGRQASSGSFFSLSYRTDDVTIYDAIADQWLITQWNPAVWTIHESLTFQTEGDVSTHSVKASRYSMQQQVPA